MMVSKAMSTPLPVFATIRHSVAAIIAAPQAFIASILPLAVASAASVLIHAVAPDSRWPFAIDAMAGIVLTVLFATNWHRALIIGQPPAMQWGGTEWRYLWRGIVISLQIMAPAILIATAVAVSPLGATEQEKAVYTFSTMGVVVLAMFWLLCPSLLRLPAAAIGQALSFEDARTLLGDNRLRLLLILGLTEGTMWMLANLLASAEAPESAIRMVALAAQPLTVGALSFAFLHLQPPATTEIAKTDLPG